MELIVQKLTEIGLKKIYFIATERSQFKSIKDNKLERFYKIALEAAEQSWSWYMPEIKVLNNFEIEGKIAILNFDGEHYKNTDLTNIDFLFI
jgi:RsmE family RNA methyltransferase